MGTMMTIVTKVAVIVILIAVGVVAAKLGWLSERGTADITTLLIKLVTPCLIVNSLLNADKLTVGEMLMASGAAALAICLAILISWCFFRKEPENRRKVLRFSVIFSNSGFMGLPLVQGIVGEQGVVYASFFIAVFNLICWTYGYGMMTGGKVSMKSAVLNPGVIGLAIGLPLYFLQVQLPEMLTESLAFVADLNTPLAMFVIGGYVARIDVRSFFTDFAVYKMSFIRLLICPAAALLVLLLIRPETDLLLSCVIQASAPVAANTVLFAAEYGGDSELASKSLAISTVLSVITIPIMAMLAQALA